MVFEVSGSQTGIELMTELPRTRGRIVMVAIVSDPPKVDLFRFFWRELQLIGARVYEPEDFERAIELAASAAVDLDALVTDCRGLDDLAGAMEQLKSGGQAMKTLIECSPPNEERKT